MLPYGYLTDPLLLQQLQCYGYGDPSQNGTLILRVRHEDMTNGRVLLETRHKVLCGNSIYKDGVYVHCYKINFGRNDKINEAPRSKTIIMKVTAANNSDLTQVNAKLRTRSKFSGENMEPISSKSRSKAFLSPSTSVQPSSPRKPEHELSIIFNLREDDKLDVIEYSTGLDERMDDMKSQLEAECIDQMLLFGWTIEEFIILIFSDLNISWYEQGQGTGLPQQANDKVFDNMKVLDLSYCKFLVKTPDLARIQNLEELILDHCECLLEIAESIGQLKHLILLSIVGCENLGTLPYGILQLNCLQLLNLKGCSKIKILPEASMMDVGLESLQQLILDNCTSLMEIPYYGGGLKCLRSLSLKGCSSLGRLPFPNGIVVVLEELILDNCTTLKEIPNNVEGLKCLRSLSLKGCSSLQRLPRSIGSLVVLKELILDHCKCLLEVSESIGQLNNLTLLSMVGCENLGALPYGILQLNCLELLNLEGCSKIKILPEARMMDVGLDTLKELHVAECIRLNRIPSLQKMRSLKVLYMNGCRRLDLNLIRLRLEEAEFHDLEALSICTESYKAMPFPFSRRGHTSCRTLHVEAINVIGRSNTSWQPSHVPLDVKVAKDGVLYVVEAIAVGANRYAASLGKDHNLNKRLRVEAARNDDSTRVGTLLVSCPIPGFLLEQVDVYMASPISHMRTT
ncbi:Disease resistance protein [Nymphaea thermarum]|nr:Disease resistance protein [Nymphaea thermarum]